MRKVLLIGLAVWASCTPFSCIDSEPVECSLAGPGCGDAGVNPDMPVVVKCSDNSSCTQAQPVCNTAGVCAPCTPELFADAGEPDAGENANSTDCPAAKYGNATHCGPAGSCVQCVNKYDCTNFNQACNNGTCGTCTQNSDCATGACKPDGSCATTAEVAYVNKSGSPACSSSAAGTAEDPYCELNEALTAGKKVLFVSGTASNISYMPVTVTLGATSETVMFVGPGSMPTNGLAANVTAATTPSLTVATGTSTANLTLVWSGINAGTSATNIAQAITCADNTPHGVALTVRDSIFTGGQNDGIYSMGCDLVASAVTIHSFGGAGITMSGSANLSIIQSKISNNTGGAGISITDAPQYLIENCFVFGQTNASHAAVELLGSSVGRFAFNSVSDNGPTGGTSANGVDCGNGALIEYSIVASNHQTTTGSVSSQFKGSCTFNDVVSNDNDSFPGKVVGTPAFVDPTADLHLVTGAASGADFNVACCIDKGPLKTVDSAALDLPYVDIDGDTRPMGTAWDVGADEVRQ